MKAQVCGGGQRGAVYKRHWPRAGDSEPGYFFFFPLLLRLKQKKEKSVSRQEKQNKQECYNLTI